MAGSRILVGLAVAAPLLAAGFGLGLAVRRRARPAGGWRPLAAALALLAFGGWFWFAISAWSGATRTAGPRRPTPVA